MAAPRRRGVTLIELLLALGLLLAIGAFALPITLETLERRAFESAGDELVGQLLLARAHARETGLPVEVLCRREGADVSGDSAASTRLDSQFDSQLDSASNAPSGGGRSTILIRTVDLSLEASESPESDELTPIALSWAERSYALSIARLSTESGATQPFEEQSNGEGDAVGGAGFDRQLASQRFERVALFVPDGSAPLAERLRLRDAAGREAFVTINPWTGLAALETPRRESSVTEDELDLADDVKPEPEMAPTPVVVPEPSAEPLPAPARVPTPAPARPRRSTGRFGSDP